MDNDIECKERHTFGIYQANGKKKEGLRKAFIEIMDLSYCQEEIKLTDNSIWPVYYEGIQPITVTRYIVSFQVYTDGTYFAVARLYKEKK